MKPSLGIALAIIAGLIGGATMTSRKNVRQLEQIQSQWRDAVEAKDQALAAARSRLEAKPDEVPVYITNTIDQAKSPETLLEELTAFDRTKWNGPWKVAHHLQELIEHGENSLPAIRNTLNRFIDVDYPVNDLNRIIDFQFLVPPTLRLGLMKTAQSIGGEQAETILAEAMEKTGRGYEVAFADYYLNQLAPAKYRNLALHVSKELLVDSPAIENPNPLDSESRQFLFELLNKYKDHSFVNHAQSMVVDDNGHLDQTAFNYLRTAMGSNVVSLVNGLYQSEETLSGSEVGLLISTAMVHAGVNEEANQLFLKVVTDDSAPEIAKLMAIRTLGRTSDPNTIKALIDLVGDATLSTQDSSTLAALQRATVRLSEFQKAAESSGSQNPFAGYDKTMMERYGLTPAK